ncbi:hypothetical protein BDQ12DRAFT_709995 [Crucibulum laeve]|uniref:Mid2 domain-containing protein n=1 Tax=Crucibulum laeve TaxID=68775 RepID=A0A5C3ME98_9AGAR|nr:hypothetical protein BDQ12DRAFT_709995 [Crucibulum laeve]
MPNLPFDHERKALHRPRDASDILHFIGSLVGKAEPKDFDNCKHLSCHSSPTIPPATNTIVSFPITSASTPGEPVLPTESVTRSQSAIVPTTSIAPLFSSSGSSGPNSEPTTAIAIATPSSNISPQVVDSTGNNPSTTSSYPGSPPEPQNTMRPDESVLSQAETSSLISVPTPTAGSLDSPDVSPSSPSGIAAASNSGKSVNIGAIAGGVIGALALLGLIGLTVLLLKRRRRNRTAPSAEFLRAPAMVTAPFQRMGSMYSSTSPAPTPEPHLQSNYPQPHEKNGYLL